MNQNHHFPEFAAKMEAAGINAPAIRAFENSYNCLVAGQTGLIPENSIEPILELPSLAEVSERKDSALLAHTVVLKLNGGLGTSMGLEGAKSLLKIKDDLAFLDFIARQILYLRTQLKLPLRFLLMNSFTTSADTLRHLGQYPELGQPKDLELMQGLAPKVDARSLRPVVWPANPQLEWCPPGHGDLYPSLLGSGRLDNLLAADIRYAFVSNSDNLGASLDLGLLTYFAHSGKSFLMEVTERTEADKKGGHLARGGNGKLLLRESAQCPETDLSAFQDIRRHRFFNTNNLWIRLDHLKALLGRHGGIVPLPLIKNAKTVDPRDKKSTPVFQLETAMGAAIECFDNSGAVNVPRSRFAPVKTTADLLALRSDAYEITDDWRLMLHPALNGQPPILDLDNDHYRLVDQIEARLPGVPSLQQCRHLQVRGPINFSPGVIFKGKVALTNPNVATATLPAGVYADTTLVVGP